MDKWQHISSAPKDGSRILISDGENISIARWETTGGGVVPDRFEWVENIESSSGFNYYNTFSGVTHWCELPDLPSESMGRPCLRW